MIKRKTPGSNFWSGKRVFITGHTGFKGGWLVTWLNLLNAKVYGLSLDPGTAPAFFSLAQISESLVRDFREDIRDITKVKEIISVIRPDIIFHMAAQPLVRTSYRDAPDTFTTNAIGTMNILESLKETDSVKVAVMITTDKVYQNNEWPYPYREIDPLGGQDPYSASKACAEMIINSYRASFFPENSPSISSVRAGNVIGGGDWSLDRLVPDAVRAFTSNSPLIIRKPMATRPWQHVLDALSGYLLLAEAQWNHPKNFSGPWNFAPDLQGDCQVEFIASRLADLWGKDAKVIISPSPDDPPEASSLRLDASKARQFLDWRPAWTLEKTLEKTIEWYKTWQKGEDMKIVSERQISEYISEE
ncbi:MAG: dTDP-glucose 4,6 dehydratase [Euryarchaeota archaeon ADurb.Bin294]|nr:MAG: dTDP-glucose 4,6 dehydratase [Euryarchaeota archaeon ADurb.Bin294]